MTTGDRVALERLLGGADLSWFVARVRTRIVAAQGEPMVGVVRLDEPTDEQRAAAVRLVGRTRRPGAALRVDLAVAEEVLRRGPWPSGLADGVVELTGPVVDAATEREQTAADWVGARTGLATQAARFPGLGEWWDQWCAGGGLKRAARAEAMRTGTDSGPALAGDLVQNAAEVLAALPASGEPLAVLARRVVGDAHGLDEARPLGRLALAVVGAAFAPGPTQLPSTDRLPSARDIWATAGVVLSNVASTVLSLGVPGLASAELIDASLRPTATAAMIEAMRGARMPLVMTLDQVRSGGVAALTPEQTVHVCENPTVVEVVADRWVALGAASVHSRPVLVCTAGQPSTAVVELLVALTRSGARCLYHGDFDWGGLRIAQGLRQRVAWSPWRYQASDYVATVERQPLSRPLTGSPADSPWDPSLARAMTAHGLAVEEEAVADLLADDVLGHCGESREQARQTWPGG